MSTDDQNYTVIIHSLNDLRELHRRNTELTSIQTVPTKLINGLQAISDELASLRCDVDELKMQLNKEDK